jgi:hypothetical protein
MVYLEEVKVSIPCTLTLTYNITITIELYTWDLHDCSQFGLISFIVTITIVSIPSSTGNMM